MLQRVGIAQALVNDPEVVFFDEPMSGLDPLGRREIRHLILRLRDRGCTVFFSSHVLSDAEALCNRVAIVAGGQPGRRGPALGAARAARARLGAGRLRRAARGDRPHGSRRHQGDAAWRRPLHAGAAAVAAAGAGAGSARGAGRVAGVAQPDSRHARGSVRAAGRTRRHRSRALEPRARAGGAASGPSAS